MIETQLSSGYASSSGFYDAFSRIMGVAPLQAGTAVLLKAAWVDTTLGPMLAIADEDNLLLLEFVDRRGLEREIERLRKRLRAAIIPGRCAPIDSIEEELQAYFNRKLTRFATPCKMIGSPFQQRVWEKLTQIPSGQTRNYAEIARALDQPAAMRAIGRANGSNQLAIVIPCHRVINSDGTLGGYGGSTARKQWLLEHEGVLHERW